MRRNFVVVGAVAGAGAVAMAAVAAHALAGVSPDRVRMVQSGVQMQGWHAVALVVTGLAADRLGWPGRWACWAFLAGMLLFCGSVYALGLLGLHPGLAAPTGGFLLMAGWLLLGLGAVVTKPAAQ